MLTKHITYKCKCKFDKRKCNPNQNWNNKKFQCKCEKPIKHRVCKKNCDCNPSIWDCEID